MPLPRLQLHPDFPVKPAHLAVWAAFKLGTWAVVGALWYLHGHFPWRTAAAAEMVAYAPIPIYFVWVAAVLYLQRRARRLGQSVAASA